MAEVKVTCGGMLRDGMPFFAVDAEGVVERFEKAKVFPPLIVFDDALVVADCGRRFNLSKESIYLSRADAVLGAIRDKESWNRHRREQIDKDEQVLKRLYAQRAELAEWAGQWPGTEVPG